MSKSSPQVIRNDVVVKTNIAVSAERELVVIKLGNVEVKLHYNDALLLDQWIRVRAKQAKAFAGDTSHNWRAVGVLHDANYGPGVTRG